MQLTHQFSDQPVSPERRAELDEVERLVQAEIAEGMTGKTWVRRGEILALRMAAHQLRKAREQKGLTLDAAAALAGIGADELGRLEAGQDSPTLATLNRVAAGYGYQVRVSIEPAVAAG